MSSPSPFSHVSKLHQWVFATVTGHKENERGTGYGLKDKLCGLKP